MPDTAISVPQICQKTYIFLYTSQYGARGGAVFEALRYKPEGRELGFNWVV
jgi:hypothetical protein